MFRTLFRTQTTQCVRVQSCAQNANSSLCALFRTLYRTQTARCLFEITIETLWAYTSIPWYTSCTRLYSSAQCNRSVLPRRTAATSHVANTAGPSVFLTTSVPASQLHSHRVPGSLSNRRPRCQCCGPPNRIRHRCPRCHLSQIVSPSTVGTVAIVTVAAPVVEYVAVGVLYVVVNVAARCRR